MSLTRFYSRLAVFAVCACSLFPGLSLLAAEKLQFNRDIRPILSDRCFKCHGPDKGSRKASLRLDLPEEAYAERKKNHKHAIVPGKPEESLVAQKILSTDPDDVMPPLESNLTLSAAEKEKIRRWIAAGAQYQPHWAFIPVPAAVPVPAVKNRTWPRNDIDRFIAQRLESARLKPSPEASRTRWLRRATYDLTGLPVAPKVLDSFLADKSPAAFEKAVDRLLASQHFGERMAVPWLDAARYADSYGYQSDQLCLTWPYRDWVVQAFNRNLPYNEFLTEQLAGDLLPEPTTNTRLATAFNRLHRQTNEGGSIEDEWRNEYVSDRVHTFSTAMLSLTFECTRCHDHKFDPLTQRDYYSLSAFFNSIDEYGTYNDSSHMPTPSLLLPTPEQKISMDKTAAALKQKTQALREATTKADPEFQDWLARTNLTPEIPGLIAKFSFDEPADAKQFTNAVNPASTSKGLQGNSRAAGHAGQGVQFTGDDELNFPDILGAVNPWQHYTVLFWVKLPQTLTNTVLFHRCNGTDTGFHGTELSIENGKLFFVIKRFWPGNAIAIQTRNSAPSGNWVQLAATYDGSGLAEGMSLFINGNKADTEIVRNHLYKSPESPASGLSFGALFRSSGLKDGLLDDLNVYSRPLADIEVRQLFDGQALNDAIIKRDEKVLREWFIAAHSPSVAKARDELKQAVEKYYAARNPVVEVSVMEEMAQPRPAFVLARGRYDAPKTPDKVVSRSTPAVLPPFPPDAPKNRLGLAQWLTEPDNPLVSRVAVNRFWQMLFGRGLVRTAENFGTQGTDPTHPELLDWLARDFVNSHWDVKALLKKIVLSATYRQDSKVRPDLQERDPENLLLARGPAQRLPAEMVRDTALAASGLLDERMGGPSVSPYQPGDLWRESNSMSPAYHQSVGTDLYRRSLYTVWKRTAPMPNMAAFDAPSREVCVVKRNSTTTPQQAFALLNDVQFVEAARVLAEKALQEGGASANERITFAFRRLTGRSPEKEELALLTAELSEQTDLFRKEPDRAEKLIGVGEHKRDATLDPIQLAATTVVAQTIMNLDATVWKR